MDATITITLSFIYLWSWGKCDVNILFVTAIERNIVQAFRGNVHQHGALTHSAWLNIGHDTIRPGDHYDWDGMRRGGKASQPGWLFQFTLKGWGWLEKQSHSKQVPTGSAFSVKIPSRHRYYADPACEEWSFFWLIANQSYIVERIIRIPQLYNRVLSLEGENSAAVLLAFRNLVDALCQDQPGDAYRVESRLMAFAYELERFTFLAQHPLAGREALLEAVRSRTTQPLSVEDLSRDFGMSRTHFSHYFRKTTGESPAAYLRKQRLKQAEILLTTSNLSIKEIAAEAGFTDANHLCKSFRAHFQCSPGDYRQLATSSLSAK